MRCCWKRGREGESLVGCVERPDGKEKQRRAWKCFRVGRGGSPGWVHWHLLAGCLLKCHGEEPWDGLQWAWGSECRLSGEIPRAHGWERALLLVYKIMRGWAEPKGEARCIPNVCWGGAN